MKLTNNKPVYLLATPKTAECCLCRGMNIWAWKCRTITHIVKTLRRSYTTKKKLELVILVTFKNLFIIMIISCNDYNNDYNMYTCEKTNCL